jgi:hypothetical protein
MNVLGVVVTPKSAVGGTAKARGAQRRKSATRHGGQTPQVFMAPGITGFFASSGWSPQNKPQPSKRFVNLKIATTAPYVNPKLPHQSQEMVGWKLRLDERRRGSPGSRRLG